MTFFKCTGKDCCALNKPAAYSAFCFFSASLRPDFGRESKAFCQVGTLLAFAPPVRAMAYIQPISVKYTLLWARIALASWAVASLAHALA